MEGKYVVLLNKNNVGEVCVLKQGLYYHFQCVCQFREDAVCRLMMRCRDRTEKIGVLIPDRDGFTLERKFPVKKFPQGSPEFYILRQGEKQDKGLFVPISADQPFEHLTKLKDAFLTTQNGRIGVWIPEK